MASLPVHQHGKLRNPLGCHIKGQGISSATNGQAGGGMIMVFLGAVAGSPLRCGVGLKRGETENDVL